MEVDEQQINLTRFNLFFPEKREFFLENQGIFGFGGVATAGTLRRRQRHPGPLLQPPHRPDPGLPVGPAAGRRTGDGARRRVHLRRPQHPGRGRAAGSGRTRRGRRRPRHQLHRAAGAARPPAAQQRRRHVHGALGRASTAGAGTLAYGVDGAFGFFDDLTINTHWAPHAERGPDRATKPAIGGTSTTPATATACSSSTCWSGDAFNPEVGFVRRRDMRRSFAEFRFSPRPQVDRLGAPLRLDRLVRLRREPRRAGRDPRDPRVVRHRARQQRRAHGRRPAVVRVPAPTLPDLARGDASGRRLRLRHGQRELRLRAAAGPGRRTSSPSTGRSTAGTRRG